MAAVRGKPWPKGFCPNPGGRPKVVGDIRALAQERTQDALDALSEIVANKKAPPAARVAAANSLLDRGYGRPLQQSEVTNITAGARKASDMTDDELVALLDHYKAMEAQETKTNGEEPKPSLRRKRAKDGEAQRGRDSRSCNYCSLCTPPAQSPWHSYPLDGFPNGIGTAPRLWGVFFWRR